VPHTGPSFDPDERRQEGGNATFGSSERTYVGRLSMKLGVAELNSIQRVVVLHTEHVCGEPLPSAGSIARAAAELQAQQFSADRACDADKGGIPRADEDAGIGRQWIAAIDRGVARQH
jgi:hypothetical protein